MTFDVHSLLIIALKSIIIYVFIILAIRLFGKKELAQLSVIDLVFILLISNSVQNAMVGADNSVLGGMAAATGLFVINYVFKWLLQKLPNFSKIVQGEEIMLIYKAMITMDELCAAVREHGVEKIEDVSLAILEVDGNISVMSNDFKQQSSRKRRAHKAITKNN